MGAEKSFPAIKKDGRARGFQHSRWPRCTPVIGRDSRKRLCRDAGLAGRFHTEVSVGGIWNPPTISAFVEPGTLNSMVSFYASRQRDPQAGLWPLREDARTWPNPGGSRGRDQVHVYTQIHSCRRQRKVLGMEET